MKPRRGALALVFGLGSVITLLMPLSTILARPVQPSDVSSEALSARATPTPTFDAYAHKAYAVGAAGNGVTVQDTPVPTATPVAPTPTPTAFPTPVRPGCVYTAPPWFDSWSDARVCEAIGVALCESTFNPYAISPSGLHHGLYQMQRSWFDAYGVDFELRYDPYINSALAARVVEDEGWWPWSCRPKG